jgi:heterodisulfide reductase subunit C
LLEGKVSLKILSKNIEFVKKIRNLSNEDIALCYQCGVCTGSCILASKMDIMPSMIIRLVQLGQMEVLESKSIWFCLSCLNCSVRCPRGIDIAKVTEALRQLSLRKDIDYTHMADIPQEELKKIPQIALISNFRKLTA